MTGAERELESRIQMAITGVTPGVCVQAHHRGEKLVDLRVGETFEFYDLASITKILFTTSRFMQLASQGNLEIESPLYHLLPWVNSPDLTLRVLLSHVSGLEWWKPFYQTITLTKTRAEKWRELQLQLSQAKVTPSEKSVYSDLDFLMLAFALEALEKVELLSCWEKVSESFDLRDIRFHIENTPKYERSRYAPTENCPWRGKVLQGEVHDDNCWALGGVSTHTGLFGGIDEVSKWIQTLRLILHDQKDRARISSAVLAQFTKRAIPKKRGDWALGFMMPSIPGASCGKYFSENSFGHTGFTGTSVWFDPLRDLSVVILSNRVHPTRANEAFKSLRPQIHDWIIETCKL